MPPSQRKDPATLNSDSEELIASVPTIDEGGDGLPAVVPLEESTRDIDEVFTRRQLQYLHSQKVRYVELRKEQRPEFVLKVSTKVIEQMLKHGKATDDKAKAQVRMKVRLWFQQHCRQKTEPAPWARAWTGRWVLYHENPEIVTRKWIEIQRENGEDIPDVPPDEDWPSEDEDGDNGKDPENQDADRSQSPEGHAPTRPPVGYFQRALSAVWNSLSHSEQKSYERKAIQWRLDGPSEAMQQRSVPLSLSELALILSARNRLAEKKLARVALDFTETVFKEMGVRVLMLVTYKNTQGATVCSTIDNNGKSTLGKKPFVKSFGKQFDESGIMPLWGAYARETVVIKEEVTIDPSLDSEPSSHPNWEPNRTVPPWSEIVTNLCTFVAPEYLPDHLAAKFKEPSAIKVGAAREIISFWRSRQAEKKVPLNIHNYINDSGEIVPREPREPVEGLEDLGSDYSCSENESDEPRKTKGPRNTKRGRDQKDSGPGTDGGVGVGARRRGKAAVRPVVKSDEEAVVEAPNADKLASPFETPPPQLMTDLPPINVPAPPPISNLDAELAGLSNEVRRLVLDALQQRTVTSLSPPADTTVGPSTTLSVERPSSPLPPVMDDPAPTFIKQSDSPVPAAAETRRKGKAPAKAGGSNSRRRRTEEEELLEMAANAGAKSGPRKSKKSSKLTG
ncbi:hypothetical protein MD484_g8359, partial [Candolleomyces efflorescens]